MNAQIDYTGLSALVAAIAAGVVSVVGALAALGARKNTKTSNGRTLGTIAEMTDARTQLAHPEIEVNDPTQPPA